jgi:hypothetical protein
MKRIFGRFRIVASLRSGLVLRFPCFRLLAPFQFDDELETGGIQKLLFQTNPRRKLGFSLQAFAVTLPRNRLRTDLEAP